MTLALLAFAAIASGQVFVGSNSSQTDVSVSVDAPAGLSASCSSTFNSTITCDIVLPAIAYAGYFATADDLSSLCTSDCLRSLQSLRTTQLDECANEAALVNGLEYPPTINVDSALWTYNYTCRKDPSSGSWCAPTFDQWGSGNDSSSSTACSDCVIGTFQSQLDSPFGWDDALVSQYSSLTSSCHATGYPVTSPSSYILSTSATSTSSAPSASHSCASQYTVQDGDDCHSVSNAQSVSTALMLYNNGLQAHCANFPEAGTQLCMPHTCDVYTVKANDTCWGIAEGNIAATVSQLISWNIDINRNCDNLEQLVGDQICVSFPGNSPAVTATASPSMATQAPVPTNVVDGTNQRCGKYYSVVAGDTCASVTQNQGISLSDFYFLNPEVNSTSCNNLYLGYSYCVQAVGNINTYAGYGGSPTNPCVGRSTSGDSSCYATTFSTGSYWTFPAMATNGSTTANSTSFSSHTITSVTAFSQPDKTTLATPTPTQSGMASDCTSFYDVQANDSCYDIAQNYGISLNQLYAWNPALNGDCTGLQTDVFICVGGPNTTATTTTTPSPTPTNGGTAPPGPTQAGIPADCNRWVMQQDGVYCYDMAQNAGITLDRLYQLNPALNGDCSGLYVGYAYCLGTASGD